MRDAKGSLLLLLLLLLVVIVALLVSFDSISSDRDDSIDRTSPPNEETCAAETTTSGCDCADPRRSLRDYLSDAEDFPTRSTDKRVRGLHVGCACGDDRYVFFAHGVSSDAPARFRAEPTAFAEVAERELRIVDNPGGYQRADLRQPFRVFDPHTRTAMDDPSAFRDGRVLLLIEGGQFVFPGVRVGHVQIVDGKRLETLSLQPLLFRVDGFLSADECAHCISLVDSNMDRMHDSGVVKMDKDKSKGTKEWRTSTQMWVKDRDSPIVANITQRVAAFTGTPASHQEDVQMLRYKREQFYSAHLDAFDPTHYGSYLQHIQYGHFNRLATLFWYLSDVDDGGETVFPRAYGLPQPADMWSCANGLKVTPRLGSIVLWYNLHPDGTLDPNSLHGGCPVRNGTKWSANKWIWNKPRR